MLSYIFVKMDPKIKVIFTLTIYFLSMTEAFDYRRIGTGSSSMDSLKLPSQVMRPVEPRLGLGRRNMQPPPPPPHPLPPFNRQSRVIVAETDDRSKLMNNPKMIMGGLMPANMPMMPQKDIGNAEMMKEIPVGMLRESIEKLASTVESLKQAVLDKNSALPPAPMKQGMGRLDVLQDMKKELKEAGMITKGSVPNSMKGVAAGDTPSMGKVATISNLKETQIETSIPMKDLGGILEVKDGLITFPADKLAEVTELLNNLKGGGLDKLVSEKDATEEIKTLSLSLEKIEELLDKLNGSSGAVQDLKNAVEDLKQAPLEKIEDLKETQMDKVEDLKDALGDLKQTPLEKVEDIKDMVTDMKEAPMEKVEDLKDAIEDMKQAPMDKVEDLRETVGDLKQDPLEKVEDLKDMLDDLKQTPQEKVEDVKDMVDDLKEIPLEKVEDLKDAMDDMKETPLEKVEDLKDMIDDLKLTPLEKVEDLKEMADDLKENPLEKVEDVKNMVDDLKETPLEKVEDMKNAVEDLKQDPMEKVEELKDVIEDIKEAPMEKVEDLKETIEDLKKDPLEKLEDLKGEIGDLKEIPTEKLNDAVDAKNSLISAPLEKMEDMKDMPVNKVEDLKDVVVNAFQQSFGLGSDRKEYFKQIVSMMSKEELGDLHEALMNAMSGVLEGIPPPKVEEAKVDLQEAVHELIETKTDDMDPGRKDALIEIEHVLEDMKPSGRQSITPVAMPVPMMIQASQTVYRLASPHDQMNSMMERQEIMLNKLLSSGSSQSVIGMIEEPPMHHVELGVDDGSSNFRRRERMISHPARRISKRAIIYGTGTTAQELRDFRPPSRLRLPMQATFRQINNAGPPDPYARAKDSLNLPLLDITEPATDKILADIKEGLQYIFQTRSNFTLAIHGTGTTGVHAIVDNVVEPGDKVLVLIHGYWGDLMANMSERIGAQVIRYKTSPGSRFSLQEIESALRRHRPDVVAVVNGESSTTVTQPLDGVGDLCHKYGALLIADVVAVAGMQPVLMDKHKIDAVATSSNKGLGSVSGLAPIALSRKAVEKIRNRLTPPRAYQTDLLRQLDLWDTSNPDRIHFQSISLPLLYALREALATIVEERMENTFMRHTQATDILNRGIAALGLEHFVENKEDRMIGITAIKPPTGKDPKKIANYMFKNYNIVISTGFGPTEGQVLRISTFGNNANSLRVTNVLRGLKGALSSRETNKYR